MEQKHIDKACKRLTERREALSAELARIETRQIHLETRRVAVTELLALVKIQEEAARQLDAKKPN